MRHTSFRIGLAALPLLLITGLAQAQQTVPPPAPEGRSMNPADETRELEGEIEAYPGPTDGMQGEPGASDVDTRIPEQIQPAPRKPALAPRSGEAASSAAAPARTNPSSAIDPSEVQRVFGSDVNIIALSSLAPAQVTRLQLRLRELGLYLAPVDGIAGPQTRAALSAHARAQFALQQRLLSHDQLTTDMAEHLGVQEGPARDADPSFRDDVSQPGTPARREGAPQLPPGAVPMTPPGVTPLPPSGGPALPTPSSTPSPSRGATPATPPPAPPAP